jgi:hypothetical protein
MLCKIFRFRGGDYEECHFLGYDEVMFRRNVLPPSSEWKCSAKQGQSQELLAD